MPHAPDRRGRSLSALTTALVGLLTLAIAVLTPAAYFFVKFTHYASVAQAESGLVAAFMAQLLARHPELSDPARPQSNLLELVDIHLSEGDHGSSYENRVLLDRHGKQLSPAAHSPHWPLVAQQTPVRQANQIVYYIRVERSLWPALKHTALVALSSCLFGALIWLGMKKIPLRALRKAEQHLLFLAHYDGLTELPNRSLFRDKLSTALAHAQRTAGQLAVLYIDLDHLKKVNDSLGHGIGDHVIHAAAQRIRNAVRASDVVARLSGDEFALLLENVTNVEGVVTVVRNIFDKLRKPFSIGGQEIFLTASAGAALYPAHGENVTDLLKNADAAMYSAKSQRDAFQFYRSEMNTHVQEEMQLEGGLRRALHNREFLLHYQPVLDAAGVHVVGMEALLRWQHPERGLVPPLRFIGLLENSGLIVEVGAWVLREACAQAKQWYDSGLGALRISVNVSGRQLQDDRFVAVVHEALAQTECPSHLLQLELTETMLMTNFESALPKLRELADWGVRISVDDFGTGYSSLAYLRRFPLKNLKIDRSFVKDLPQNGDTAAIVSAVIQLAHALRIDVTAEGVEVREQIACLGSLGCDTLQGFCFSKPLPPPEFERYLREVRAMAEPVALHSA